MYEEIRCDTRMQPVVSIPNTYINSFAHIMKILFKLLILFSSKRLGYMYIRTIKEISKGKQKEAT